MLRLSRRVVGHPSLLLLLVLSAANSAFSQVETATVSGQVVDPSGLSITGAQVRLIDIDRDTASSTTTNNSGLYTFPSVRPARYRMEVAKDGFRIVNVTGLIVNVQDHLEQNFRLTLGSVSESVTVEASSPLVNIESAAVSTVVDRNFAENLPMNGRSLQTLIDLTPGVVLTPSTSYDGGQFSVNGQRATSNYWTVDGVSANIGIGGAGAGGGGNGTAGALPSFSVLGGTNSLVSVDALQEFRIQTSTYAPEFGRTPGGQISIVTRSGTNQFHGTTFDYLRNDALDASDWFDAYTNTPPLPKAEERQNDFGGIFSGPILKDRTFFFFSYEGLRLRLPRTLPTTVPDLLARQDATLPLQPYLNAYPLPNGADLGNGIAMFNASYSNPASLDAYSLRIDDKLHNKLNLFGRYNYSPSKISERGVNGFSLSTLLTTTTTTQTGTVGLTWAISTVAANDLRFNYSRTHANSQSSLDAFGGAAPLTSLPFPNPFSIQNSSFAFDILSLNFNASILFPSGKASNIQRQINIVDDLSIQRGSHSLKFGVDFRRLSPTSEPIAYSQQPYFIDVPSAATGSLLGTFLLSSRSATVLLRNVGAFAQDTWRTFPRLTLTYGLRWDLDFAPSSVDGPSLPAVTGFDLNNLSNLALAQTGTPPFKTTYGNVAPRVGAAYQLTENPNWAAVLRSGFGVFYDLATSGTGNNITVSNFPFGAGAFPLGGTFPLPPSAVAPPAISPGSLSLPGNALYASDPNLKLPYTLQWNVALEQSLGNRQTLTASYIGAVGRRLLQSVAISSPNLTFGAANLITNTATSEYDGLQLQYQRRLLYGLQMLASYTWSHSIDTGSTGSYFNASNTAVPGITPKQNRGPSDFDVRNAFTAGATYEIPTRAINTLAKALLHGWSIENLIEASSAPPVNVIDATSSQFLLNSSANVRPDVVAGQPFYIHGAQCVAALGLPCPGGSGFNPNAFAAPPSDPNTGRPIRQGTLGRNALRGFGATQWDFAVHRDFPIHESLRLQFRAEMFNVLNHPNFGPPSGAFDAGGFGLSTQMLAQYLNGGGITSTNGGGGFNPLYQIGGPRSIQLALKFIF